MAIVARIKEKLKQVLCILTGWVVFKDGNKKASTKTLKIKDEAL